MILYKNIYLIGSLVTVVNKQQVMVNKKRFCGNDLLVDPPNLKKIFE